MVTGRDIKSRGSYQEGIISGNRGAVVSIWKFISNLTHNGPNPQLEIP